MKLVNVLTIAGLLLLGAASSRANEKSAKFKLTETAFKVSPSDAKLDVDAGWDSDGDAFNGIRLGLKLTLPVTSADSSVTARLDEFPQEWKIGPSFVWESSTREPPDFSKAHEFMLRLSSQWSVNRFQYQPLESDKRRTLRASFINEAFAYWHRIGEECNWAWSVQGRWTQQYEAQDKVGIVSPGTDGSPATVAEQRVIAAPQTAPSLLVRTHFFLQGRGSSIAWGPTVALATTGDQTTDVTGIASPLNDDIVLRMSVWLYFFPVSSPANLRIGLSPVVDVYMRGETDEGDTVRIGVLANVRIGTPNFVF